MKLATDNKENFWQFQLKQNLSNRNEEILMIPKWKDPLNLNTFRKVSPNYPDESLQFFSIESMCSEKSVSEGLLKKEIPDS